MAVDSDDLVESVRVVRWVGLWRRLWVLWLRLCVTVGKALVGEQRYIELHTESLTEFVVRKGYCLLKNPVRTMFHQFTQAA